MVPLQELSEQHMQSWMLWTAATGVASSYSRCSPTAALDRNICRTSLAVTWCSSSYRSPAAALRACAAAAVCVPVRRGAAMALRLLRGAPRAASKRRAEGGRGLALRPGGCAASPSPLMQGRYERGSEGELSAGIVGAGVAEGPLRWRPLTGPGAIRGVTPAFSAHGIC